jgi:ubiquinone/menaquinone biosynthesis C-methylase UbiE
MEKVEMDAFEDLTKQNYKRWMMPFIDNFVARSHLSKGFIIDVACGPGLLSKGLGEYSSSFRVVGVDISNHALRLARKNCAKLPNVSFKRGSVYDLPFKNETADAVVCKDSLHHFEKPTQAFKEMLRVLKKGGYLYLQDLRRDLPTYLIQRSVARDTTVQQLQYYSTRAAYTKDEIGNILNKMGLRPVYLATPLVTSAKSRRYKSHGIDPSQLKEGFQARYILVIKK